MWKLAPVVVLVACKADPVSLKWDGENAFRVEGSSVSGTISMHAGKLIARTGATLVKVGGVPVSEEAPADARVFLGEMDLEGTTRKFSFANVTLEVFLADGRIASGTFKGQIEDVIPPKPEEIIAPLRDKKPFAFVNDTDDGGGKSIAWLPTTGSLTVLGPAKQLRHIDLVAVEELDPTEKSSKGCAYTGSLPHTFTVHDSTVVLLDRRTGATVATRSFPATAKAWCPSVYRTGDATKSGASATEIIAWLKTQL